MPCGGVRKLALVDLRPELLDQGERPLEGLRDAGLDPLGLARELARHAEAEALRSVARGQLDSALDADRGRVAVVAALHGAQQQRGVGDVARERSALVERRGEGDHPVAGDRAVGRLQADDPAQRRRLADRPAGVGPDRPRGEAGRRPAAAEPPEEPPGTRSRSQGLRTGP